MPGAGNFTGSRNNSRRGTLRLDGQMTLLELTPSGGWAGGDGPIHVSWLGGPSWLTG